MSTATKEDSVDEARDALVSDVQELKSSHLAAIAANAKTPWVMGGIVGVALIGLALRKTAAPRRRSWNPSPPSLLERTLRAAVLAATGLVARRYAQRFVDSALPEPKQTRPRPSAPAVPA